ncbi:MAG TPA: alcohol dehydrogenase [Balneolales bacterium]|nr:alcohol dehydrogenase [Balneolales bacterium]
MSTMKAVQISKAGGDFELVERDIPEPYRHEIRIKVEACGICHSDAFVKEGLFPGIEFPRIPGHEVIGRVDKVGADVTQWSEGQRVGVGWHGGHCFECEACRNGDFINCENAKITGISFDGGYAEYMVAPQEAIARIPDELDSAEAAPLLCAGITTYNALRNSEAKAGDLVAVQGIGGLGHLGVQYANKMGFETVALSRGTDKKKLAYDLGARHYIDTDSESAAEELQKMGGAKVILSTAPNSKAITSVLGGLGRDGQLMIVAASGEPVEVSPMMLIGGRKSIKGWPSGHAKDSEDTLNFSALKNTLPMVETYPLEKAAEAYERMITNKARFRVVLTMTE